MSNQSSTSTPTPEQLRWLITLALLVTLVVVGFLLFGFSNTNDPSDNDALVDEQSEPPTITITEQGFEPEEILVLPDSRIRWVNNSDEPVLIASNPYPENDAHPELNAETPIGPGESFEATVSDVGSYDFHDDYDPLMNGRITVIEDPDN